MTIRKLATFAIGLALAAPLGLAGQASATTVVHAIFNCPCSNSNPLGTLLATKLVVGTTYDFTFSLGPPQGTGIDTLLQAQAAIKGPVNKIVAFTLFSNLDPPTLLDPNDLPVAGTNWGTASGTSASLDVLLPVGDYFLQVAPTTIKGETLTGGVTVVGVPEPASWALMLVGFGGLGYALRSRRKLAKARI